MDLRAERFASRSSSAALRELILQRIPLGAGFI